jgi:dTDP-3-amino-3,4,6-trideoxy-alpha-D-glucose transaminase
VTGSSGFILGQEVEAFEDEFAAYCGASHCVGLASGTAAITLMLQAAGIGPGDEVVVPAHTYVASAFAVVHAGAAPVFCDVEPDTGLIDPAAAEAAVTPRTAAILAVHLYGQCVDTERLGAVANRHSLALFEDAAQAHGATSHGRRAGSLGAAGAFSFYPSKNLGALGDAGAICTSDSGLAERARQLRNLGQRRKGEHVVVGHNERLDGLQAAFLRVKLPHLERWNRRRREVADRYRAGLDGQVRLVTERPATPSVHHLFPVRVDARDALARDLAAAGISSQVHYAPAVPDQPPFRDAAAATGFPAARAWANEELSLPIHGDLTDADVERVVSACLDSVRNIAA